MSQSDPNPVHPAGLLSVLGLVVTLLVAMISALATRLEAVDERACVSGVTIEQRLTRIEAKLDLLSSLCTASQRPESRALLGLRKAR